MTARESLNRRCKLNPQDEGGELLLSMRIEAGSMNGGDAFSPLASSTPCTG